jgi:hypothetical protein
MSQEILVDGRGLEPPEPLEHVLAAIERMRSDQHVRLLLRREPLPLFGMLESMGFVHQTHLLPGGEYEIVIERRRDTGRRA